MRVAGMWVSGILEPVHGFVGNTKKGLHCSNPTGREMNGWVSEWRSQSGGVSEVEKLRIRWLKWVGGVKEHSEVCGPQRSGRMWSTSGRMRCDRWAAKKTGGHFSSVQAMMAQLHFFFFSLPTCPKWNITKNVWEPMEAPLNMFSFSSYE